MGVGLVRRPNLFQAGKENDVRIHLRPIHYCSVVILLVFYLLCLGAKAPSEQGLGFTSGYSLSQRMVARQIAGLNRYGLILARQGKDYQRLILCRRIRHPHPPTWSPEDVYLVSFARYALDETEYEACKRPSPLLRPREWAQKFDEVPIIVPPN